MTNQNKWDAHARLLALTKELNKGGEKHEEFTPEMQQKAVHAPIQNEAGNGLKNELGTLSMARTTDPHSANAQFFINLKENSFLDYSGPGKPGYAVFGKVVQGLDIVRQIATVPTGNSGAHQNVPMTPIVIESVRPLAANK